MLVQTVMVPGIDRVQLGYEVSFGLSVGGALLKNMKLLSRQKPSPPSLSPSACDSRVCDGETSRSLHVHSNRLSVQTLKSAGMR